MSHLKLNALAFAYPSAVHNAFDNLNTTFGPGWTGLVGPNGCGKSTLLRLIAGRLVPISGRILGPELRTMCAQDTLESPEDWQDFLSDRSSMCQRIKSELSLHKLLSRSWQHLSCGEQKRFQIGCALRQRPEVLLLDEPSNHLDEKNRNFLLRALMEYQGIGLIVSHDRELLNALCKQFLFFVDGQIYSVSGSYDEAKLQIKQQFDQWNHSKSVLQDQAAQVARESQRLHEATQKKQSALSKGKLNKHDHDARARINLARLTGKDASFDQKRMMSEQKLQRLQGKLSEVPFRKDYGGSIEFEAATRGHQKYFLTQPSSKISLPDGSTLRIPELFVSNGARVGIVGENGVGKTSLLQIMVKQRWFDTERFLYLLQELDANAMINLKTKLSSLSRDDYARVLQIVARLGTDASRVNISVAWSPGETRKMALALSIVHGCEFFVLDEPTNHLDLPSLERLEEALIKSSLTWVIVSHDQEFISHVCTQLWVITRTSEGHAQLVVEEV